MTEVRINTPKLTLERLFSDPDLNGRPPIALKFSPDSQRVTWLQGSENDFEQLDLWAFDRNTGESRMLVAAESLGRADVVLSDQEKAMRERKRITQSGIVEYYWHPDSSALLFPLDGTLYLYRLADGKLIQLTPEDTFETDLRFSPDGRYLSFVRDQDLYALRLDDLHEIRLTQDGGGTISNGVAEFIAQEEMHRFEGYWWSPDSRHIAFTRVDEAPVQLTQRYEIDADRFSVYDQRYPFAGTPNAQVDLGIASLDGDSRLLAFDRAADAYLGRIDWTSESGALLIQVQSRNQQRLDLSRLDIASGDQSLLLTETSDTWINLDDNLRSLASGELVWGSERSGIRQLYLLDAAGHVIRQLTHGEGPVLEVKAIDEKKAMLYFEGLLDTPLERHLYRVPLGGDAPPSRLTRHDMSHQVALSPDCACYIDRYSSAEQPVAVDLLAETGDLLAAIGKGTLDADHPFTPFANTRGKVGFGELAAADGQMLHYRLIEPAGREPGQRYPVIITVYGGPGVQRVTNEWIPPWHQYMASRGYGLLQLDNRGSTNRGKRFEDPIYRTMGVAEVADQLRGVQMLGELDWVDIDRIGVFGHSYGGYMTLMLLMKSPGTFRCGVSVAPVTDWKLYDTHYTERYLGQPDENPQGYEQSSVFPWAHQLRDKLLLIHGMADDNVLFTHSTKLYKVLQDANIQFEIMNYPGAKHGLSGKKTNLHRYSLMDHFFDTNLKEP